jgi:hypothetical protein
LEQNSAEAARKRFQDRETRLARIKREHWQRIEEKKRALRDDNAKQKKIAAAIERVQSRQDKPS